MHQDTKASELDAAIEEVREDLRQEFARTFKDHAEIAHLEGVLMNLLQARLQMLRSRLGSLGSGERS